MRRFSSGLLALLLCLLLFPSCGHTVQLQDNRLVIGQKLNENQLIRIGGETVTVEEAKMFLLSEKKRILCVYGAEIFDQVIAGKSFSAYMDEELRAFLIRMAQIDCMADRMGLSLNNTEQDRVEQAANEYYRGLTSERRTALGITLDTVLSAYRHYYLMQKVLNNIGQEMDLEISDDEARVITVQQIFVTRYETAEEVVRRAEAGTDFERLGSIYNESAIFKRTISRGDLSDTYENAVFSLSNGAISTIFHENDGYYVVKCLNNYEMDLTMSNKENLAAARVTEEFEKRFAEFLGSETLSINENAFQGLSFTEDYGGGGENFFEVYDTHF